MPTKLFVDRLHAAEILGVKLRQFDRIAENANLKPLQFRTNAKTKHVRHIFLRSDVEKLRQ